MPDGYVCVRVDSRGAGRSPGLLDVWSPRETQDLYHCIEWAGTQPWSNGKVGINGISYYAMNQWTVGALKPPHLAALCIWEGSSDYYRELSRHGGILCDFSNSWHPRQVGSVQHGVGSRGAKSAVTGELVAGPDTLRRGRTRRATAPIHPAKRSAARSDDDYYARRTADSGQIEAPLLSAATGAAWACTPAAISKASCAPARKQKWLEVHGDTHFTHFYSNYGETLQKRFFGHFLKGEDTGWEQAAARCRSTSAIRARNSSCAPRTNGRSRARNGPNSILHPARASADAAAAACRRDARLRHDRRRDHLSHAAATAKASRSPARSPPSCGCRRRPPTPTFSRRCGCSTRPARRSPSSARTIRACRSGSAGCAPRSASSIRRESLPYRPWHTHDEEWPLQPGEPVELDIEIWPTSIVVPPGYRLALTVSGKDYEVDGGDIALPNAPYPMKGVGPFLHIDPRRSAGRDFRYPQHPALRRTSAALPLVAGHSRSVSFEQNSKRPGETFHDEPCRVARERPCLAFSPRSRPHRLSNIPTVPSPSSCPTRPAARSTKPPASSRNRSRTSSSKASSSKTSAAATPSSAWKKSRMPRPTATRCSCIICRSPRTCRCSRRCRSTR